VNAREYRDYVERLEQAAAKDPHALRTRVRLLVAAGYGYVVLMLGVTSLISLLLLVALVTGNLSALAIKLLLVSGALSILIGRSLWVRIGTPEGIALPRGAAPKLRERLEVVRRALKAPRVDHVLITMDFNASVTQVPRFGIFGWQRTYLTLGLPLLYAMGPRQFDAILAHEYGHLSGAHPKLGFWVARVGRTWSQLLAQFERSQTWGKFLFERFFKWFVPRLQAYGSVMSRRDEFAADADAAAVTSPRALGEALVALELRGISYERYYWPRFWQRAEREPEAPTTSWSLLRNSFKGNDDARERRVNLAFAVRRRSIVDDTHPSLSERLHAIGLLPSVGAANGTIPREVEDLIVPVEETAADHYLEGAASEWTAAWDTRWRFEQAQNWKNHHERAKTFRARLNELNAKPRESLTNEELWELAGRSAEIDGVRASADLLRAVIASDPKHAHARVMLGTALLEDGDDAGLELLKQAMEIDPAAVGHCESMMRWFLAGIGDRAAAAAAEDRLAEHHKARQAEAEERNAVHPDDTLIGPRLSFGEIQRIADAIRSVHGVREVFIARKHTKHAPLRPFYVIYLITANSWLSSQAQLTAAAQSLLNVMQFEKEADTMVVPNSSKHSWLRKKILEAGGVRVGPHGAIE
jgi:Zn-dependent protease with chaperone function